MAEEANRALVDRYIEMYVTGNLTIADEIIGPEFVDHSHPEVVAGPEGEKQLVIYTRTAFPDLACKLETVICERNWVAFRGTLSGHHRGKLGAIPATGKFVTFDWMDFVRIANGKFAELWTNQDTLGLLKQLGALP